jgi:hypothetical protein
MASSYLFVLQIFHRTPKNHVHMGDEQKADGTKRARPAAHGFKQVLGVHWCFCGSGAGGGTEDSCCTEGVGTGVSRAAFCASSCATRRASRLAIFRSSCNTKLGVWAVWKSWGDGIDGVTRDGLTVDASAVRLAIWA